MENVLVKVLLKKALAEYDMIYEEYCRPHRDMVMMAECDMIKDAISLLLKAYLQEKGIVDTTSNDIEELLGKCKTFDENFAELNLSPIVELDAESRMARNLALEDGLLIECLKTLQQSKQMILTKLGVSELSLS